MKSFAKIAAVGDKDKMLIFKAIGVDVYYSTRPSEVKEIILRLEREEYNLIIVTESTAKQIDDFIQEYAEKPYPIILAIPDSQSASAYGHEKILRNIERAVGNSKFLGE